MQRGLRSLQAGWCGLKGFEIDVCIIMTYKIDIYEETSF